MPRATDVDITPAGQRPDEDPSLAVRNNGGSPPSAEPAPAGRREALLVLSFGGPEGHEDVMPFLENVTRGRGIPRERLLDVAEHYHHFGGVSPINEQNKALIAAVEKDLAAAGVDLPVYWGNRNWAPYVEDTWRADGRRRHRARLRLRDVGLRLVLRLPAVPRGHRPGPRRARRRPDRGEAAALLRHPGLRAGQRRRAGRGARLAARGRPRDTARLVATAHSIPDAMAAVAGPDGGAYEAELLAAAERVVAEVAPGRPFDLVWQSRSGPPSVPWLEPDVNDHLRALAEDGETAVVLFPVGFISDHLEVIWDLDNEARETAEELGPGLRPRRDGRHPPGVRRHGAGAARGAPRRRPAAPGHQLPGVLLFRATMVGHRPPPRPGAVSAA